MTIEEYATSNYRFLNRQQSMLFISHGAKLMGCYVSHNTHTNEYNLVYVFAKNRQNEELLTKFRNYELSWGDNIIEFEAAPTIIVNTDVKSSL